MRANVQVNPPLLATRPISRAHIGLIPDIPDETFERIIGLQVGHQPAHEFVIVRPIPIIARPHSRRIGMISPPDIMRQQDKSRTKLATSPIIGQRRLRPSLVVLRAPDPASSGGLELRATGARIVESDIRVPVVWDLALGIGDPVEDARGPVDWFALGDVEVDRGRAVVCNGPVCGQQKQQGSPQNHV